jgi:hypothetical protein
MVVRVRAVIVDVWTYFSSMGMMGLDVIRVGVSCSRRIVTVDLPLLRVRDFGTTELRDSTGIGVVIEDASVVKQTGHQVPSMRLLSVVVLTGLLISSVRRIVSMSCHLLSLLFDGADGEGFSSLASSSTFFEATVLWMRFVRRGDAAWEVVGVGEGGGCEAGCRGWASSVDEEEVEASGGKRLM